MEAYDYNSYNTTYVNDDTYKPKERRNNMYNQKYDKQETIDLLNNEIYPNLDIDALLPELSPKSTINAWRMECPECGKKELYMVKPYNSHLKCNRLNKCAYTSSLWNYIKRSRGIDNKEVLHLLAENAGVVLEDKPMDFNRKPIAKPIKQEDKKVQIINFNYNEEYEKVVINQLIREYLYMDKRQRFEMLTTFIYRYSLGTDRTKMYQYHYDRMLPKSDYMDQLGFLSKKDIYEMNKLLEKYFGLDDLVEFKIYGDSDAKKPYQFKWMPQEGIVVVPNFNLYNDLTCALRFRNIDKNAWFKEVEISREDLLISIPFGITNKLLQEDDLEINITEGYPDGLALEEPFMMCPGANRFKDEWFGMLINCKKINVWFDSDEAGKEGLKRFKEKAEIYLKTVEIEYMIWDNSLGKDPNDLLKNDNLFFVKYGELADEIF